MDQAFAGKVGTGFPSANARNDSSEAPRRPWRFLSGALRGAGLAFALAVSGAGVASAEASEELIVAEYADPTLRYDHGVLGDAVEWGTLVLRVNGCADCALPEMKTVTIRLPETRVFEDTVPRVVQLPEGGGVAMVVESDLSKGARLALYDSKGLKAATPFIGRPHRWLAPIGAGDLDGDGTLEIAYIDRPHLAKTLRIWRLDGDSFTEVTARDGFTNHQIGWDHIAGGLRDCGDGPEMIVASADWSRLKALRFDGTLTARDLGAYSSLSERAALACE